MSVNQNLWFMKDKLDMSSHKNISEKCMGAEQVSHQKYYCTIYDVIKYLYSVNVI